jgi:predicted transposase YbfD/YdcC
MMRLSQAKVIEKENEEQALLFFKERLSQLPDPRRRQGKRYPLETVVVIGLMAVVCGAEDAQAMELWGHTHEDWLETFLDLPHGYPTQDVYLSVFAALSPEAFAKVLAAWAALLSLRLANLGGISKQIALDGKSSRRSYDSASDKPAIHTIAAWSCEAGIVLGKIRTDEKSNEITALPGLLELLDIKGCTLTYDAMGCQTDFAKNIVQRGGYYLLATKANQPTLHHDIETLFDYVDGKVEPNAGIYVPKVSRCTAVEKGHGRIEQRTTELCRELSHWISGKRKWAGLNFVVRVRRERTILKTGKTSTEVAYYIGNDPTSTVDIVASQIRRHWAIENELHWVLDMAFREDEARHRAGNTAHNMATLRHFALNIIKQDKNRTCGIANTRKLAGWNHEYLLNLFIQGVV